MPSTPNPMNTFKVKQAVDAQGAKIFHVIHAPTGTIHSIHADKSTADSFAQAANSSISPTP